jgi:hypothetical protein
VSRIAQSLVGNQYGDLTVREYLGHQVWRCDCACGGSRDVVGYALKSGSAKHCFTCHPSRYAGRPREDIIGQQFSQLTPEEYLGHRVYRCRCTCGNTREASATELRTGKIKRCLDCKIAISAQSRWYAGRGGAHQ